MEEVDIDDFIAAELDCVAHFQRPLELETTSPSSKMASSTLKSPHSLDLIALLSLRPNISLSLSLPLSSPLLSIPFSIFLRLLFTILILNVTGLYCPLADSSCMSAQHLQSKKVILLLRHINLVKYFVSYGFVITIMTHMGEALASKV